MIKLVESVLLLLICVFLVSEKLIHNPMLG